MKITNEAKIGIMVSLAVVVLVALTVKSGNFSFSKEGYTIKVHFHNIDGISLNAPVMYNGLEVGRVEEITINEDHDDVRMELTLWIDESARLKEGAEAYVKNMGFLGEKYVGLSSGKSGGAVLAPGSLISGKDPADFDVLVTDGQELAKQLKEIATNVNTRLKKNEEAIDRIVTNLDTSMVHFSSITANVDERLTKNAQHIDNIFAKLDSSAVNLDQFTYDLKQNPWKLMYRSREKRMENVTSGKNSY